MLRSHLGFGLFLLLLLVAPKLPVALSGGAARSGVSLGFIGFIGWYLLCPERLFRYPVITVRHAFFWVLAFALYAFIISLLSTKTVSIAYSIQFLFYSVCGIALMGCRALRPAPLHSHTSRSILFAVGITYCLGVLVSVYVGPIYSHQTLATRRHWGGFIIPQGIGFAESQNIAGAVTIVFLMAIVTGTSTLPLISSMSVSAVIGNSVASA